MVIAVALSREQDMANSLVATRLQALRWNLTVFPCNTPALYVSLSYFPNKKTKAHIS